MKRIIFGLMLAMTFLHTGARRKQNRNRERRSGEQEKSHRIERHCHQWRNRNRHTQHHDL